jgi:hypothetical protein
MDHLINLVLSAILFLGSLVFAVIGFIDGFLASLMSAIGIPPQAQLIILLVAAIIIMAYAIRALGGLFAILLLILLVLLVLHQAFPGFHMPSYTFPPAGTVNT